MRENLVRRVERALIINQILFPAGANKITIFTMRRPPIRRRPLSFPLIPVTSIRYTY